MQNASYSMQSACSNFFLMPACFMMALAVWRDLIL